MAYVKIENNIIVQKQPNAQDGFVSVHDSIVCGMVHDGGESFAKDKFSAPVIPLTWDDIREDRYRLLSTWDWTQTPDSPLSGNQAWVDYRQSLRDITETFDNPDDVVWPEIPA